MSGPCLTDAAPETAPRGLFVGRKPLCGGPNVNLSGRCGSLRRWCHLQERGRGRGQAHHLRDGSSTHQRNAHDLMPNRERDSRPLLLGQRQKLGPKLAHHVAIERYLTRDPEAVRRRLERQPIKRDNLCPGQFVCEATAHCH